MASGCGLCCSRDPFQGGTFIFHYGCNNPGILAAKLNCSKEDIINRAIPCILRGYREVFSGKSKSWGNKSVSTLIKVTSN